MQREAPFPELGAPSGVQAETEESLAGMWEERGLVLSVLSSLNFCSCWEAALDTTALPKGGPELCPWHCRESQEGTSLGLETRFACQSAGLHHRPCSALSTAVSSP